MEYVCSTSDSSIFPLAPGLTGTPTWATHSDTARRARRPHRRRAGQSRAAGREAGGGGSAVAAAPSREARSGHRLTAPLTPPPPPYCPAGGGAAPAGRRPLVACGELPGRPAGRGVALTGWSHSLYRGCVRWLRQPRPEGAVLEACPAVQRDARLASCKERSFKCSMV